MPQRPKDKGTRRETLTARSAEVFPGIYAQRAPNHAPSYDITARVAGLGEMRWEVKDRQQLNAHKTVMNAQAANPEHPVVLVWHRTSKPDGAKRSRPDGPTLAMMDESLFYQLLSLAGLAAMMTTMSGSPQIVAGCMDDVRRVLESLDTIYDGMRQ